jgi:hypothetical protein
VGHLVEAVICLLAVVGVVLAVRSRRRRSDAIA